MMLLSSIELSKVLNINTFIFKTISLLIWCK
jgi:hypothetical protein